MNRASEDLPLHLGELRRRLEHPTDYEQALHYFLEEFAGDEPFIRASEADDAPHLAAVVRQVVGAASGRGLKPERINVFHLRAHRFHHGNATVDGRVVLFFCFGEAGLGFVAVMPGFNGPADAARFRLPEGLRNPANN
jgi:hypothetical protein